MPAAVVLAVCLTVAAGYLAATRTEARVAAGPSLAQLEVAIADPDAGGDTWLRYAQRLAECRRYAHAAQAFQKVLERDPSSRAANLQCAAAMARSGDAEAFYTFAHDLLKIDPRLAQDVLLQTESQPYLREARYGELLTQARIQSMD